MKKQRTLWLILSLFTFSLFFATALAEADVFIKKTRHTKEAVIQGQIQPAKDEEGGTWLGNDVFKEEIEGDSIIIRFDLNKIYTLNHSEKTYSEIDLPFDLEKILPADALQMMQMMQVTASFTETGETQKIKDWDCKKYFADISVSMMGMTMPGKMEIWATKDVDIDFDLFKKSYGEILLLFPFLRELSKVSEKIDGLPVFTTLSMNINGADTGYEEEVVSIETKDAPPGTYELPKGYIKIAFNPFKQR
jgi:hypothetical protein